jgi:hypothetical protein
MNLDISTSIAFVIKRTEKTTAVQSTLAALPGASWVWPSKSLAAWQADLAQLDGAKSGSLAHTANAAKVHKSMQLAALNARCEAIHACTLQAVGVMRSRALADPLLRPVVDELSARGDSKPTIEDEGEELLAAWSQEFGEDFLPAPGNTYASFQELFLGTASEPSLSKLKSNYKEAVTKARRADGDYNRLISRLEDECIQWYAEATAVFPAGTTNGDLIRGQIPTNYNPPTPAPAPPSPPA